MSRLEAAIECHICNYIFYSLKNETLTDVIKRFKEHVRKNHTKAEMIDGLITSGIRMRVI